MGKRGPAPAPTNLKVVRGERKDRINRSEPRPGQGDVVPPEDLPPAAREVWDRLAPDLIAKRVLTAWDVDLFARFCRAVPISRAAWADVEKHGTAVTTLVRELSDGTAVYELRKNPAWQVAREATAVMTTVGMRFGLSPADRSQLSVGGESRGSSDDLLSG